MKYYLSLFLCLWLAASCRRETPRTGDNNPALKAQIDQLGEVRVNPGNLDSVRNAWIQLCSRAGTLGDTLQEARANYFMARFYGMQGLDSATWFIEKALELIEPTNGNMKEKALIYNGLGNTYNQKAKNHQAGYYYNKAAAIVMSDTSLDMTPDAKTVLLLSAAQSSAALYQYGLAIKMNYAALKLAPLLPPQHPNRMRVLVQIIQVYRMQFNADSMAPYLRQAEELLQQQPDVYDPTMLYGEKASYYWLSGNRDGALKYYLLQARNHEQEYKARPQHPTTVNNLFITWVNIAALYNDMKQTGPATVYFGKAAALREQYPDFIETAHRVIEEANISGLYELQGHMHKALNALDSAYRLQKKQYQTENIQAVAELSALYQLQAKDRSISRLNENIKVNQLQLQQNRLWLLIALLFSLLLALLLLFFNYRQKQRRLRQEEEKVSLQQQLLRTQMEPHFIFNTLSALQSLIRFDNKDAAIKYLNRFSRLLRSSLELSREALVSLDDEIEALENYLDLQQMRFEYAFTYEIVLPEDQDMEAVLLPPMLIQPFVENAILHGIDLKSKTGFVKVHFAIRAHILVVTITDSGRGQEPAEPAAHRSLSGAISRERLGWLGREASLTVSAGDPGTVVVLQIPFSGD